MSTGDPNTDRRPRRRRRLFLALAIGFVAAILLAEVGVRIVLWARGKTFDSANARAAILLDVSRARDFVPRVDVRDEVPADQHAQERFLHPYLGWEIFGGLENLKAEAQRLDDPSTAGDYEILLVGGSVAAVFEHLGWPRFLERIQADPRFAGKRIHLMPFAHGAYKEPQTVILVQYLLAAGFTPECVLDIDGFNDVAIANDNAARGVSPILPAAPQWTNLVMNGAADRECVLLAAKIVDEQGAIEGWGRFALDWGLHKSALLHTLVHRRIRTLQASAFADSERHAELLRGFVGRVVLRGPPFRQDGVDPVRKAVRAWAECSRSLSAICRERGISYVQVLQPTLHDEGAKPISSEELEKCGISSTWLEGVRAGYPLLRAEGARLAAEGVNFVDASRVFEKSTQTLYYDGCHFGEEGNRIFAEHMATEFLKQKPWR